MRDPVLAALGRRLAARRHDKKLSQEDLAVKAGLSAKFISSVERGGANPSILSLHQLATAMDVPLTALLEDDTARDVVQLIDALSGKEQERLLRIVKAYCAR